MITGRRSSDQSSERECDGGSPKPAISERTTRTWPQTHRPASRRGKISVARRVGPPPLRTVTRAHGMGPWLDGPCHGAAEFGEQREPREGGLGRAAHLRRAEPSVSHDLIAMSLRLLAALAGLAGAADPDDIVVVKHPPHLHRHWHHHHHHDMAMVPGVPAASAQPHAACTFSAAGYHFDLSGLRRASDTNRHVADWETKSRDGKFTYHLNVCADTMAVPPVCRGTAHAHPSPAYQSAVRRPPRRASAHLSSNPSLTIHLLPGVAGYRSWPGLLLLARLS